MKKKSLFIVKARLKELWKDKEMDLETRAIFEEYIIKTSGYSEVEFFVLCSISEYDVHSL